MHKNGKAKKVSIDVITYIILTILAAFCLIPFIWQISSSFKTMPELMKGSSSIIPEKATIGNYLNILKNFKIYTYMLNSFLVSFFSMLVSMALSSLASYALIRYFPKISNKVTRMMITTYMFPAILLAVPYFIIMSELRLSNSLIGLGIVYLTFSVPYCTWMLTGYFKSIPLEIEEAAKIDGASKWKTFYRISFPLVAPGAVATATFAFINAWNEFLYSLVLINSGSRKTISVALYSLVGGETMRYGDMMAASVLVVVPTLLLFFAIQRHLTGGMTGGAIK